MPVFDANSSGSGIYTAMDGVKWGVWVDFPSLASIDGPYVAGIVSPIPSYGIKDGRKLVGSLGIPMSRGSVANKAVIQQIEAYGARWRQQQKGAGWLVFAVLAFLILKDKRQT
jgi:hypothetical protein